jgi:hypothetical protein
VVINIERTQGMSVMSKLVDVGFGGGRIRGAQVKVAAGDRLRMSFFKRDLSPVTARVAWVHGPEIGIEFFHALPAERPVIAALVSEAQFQLATAYEAIHPAMCPCVQGQPVAEPPLPRSAHRMASS